MQLVLASTSLYRRKLLERLRLPFIVDSSGVDESDIKASGRSPREVAIDLAQAKSCALQKRYPRAAIIGGDQVATIENEILDKPGSTENAFRQLKRLSGHSHQLMTAVSVLHERSFHDILDITTLTMRMLTDEEINRYIVVDNPIDCTGSYKIESLGISLFERIESADHSAIEGLPLIALSTLLRSLGFSLP